jgi:hypothetical protein
MSSNETTPLKNWVQIPQNIARAIEGLTEEELDLRGGSNDWSIRETVHHLVEANLIASNIVIAGLAQSGCTYDWSWVNPDRSWMERAGYSSAPVAPAIETLKALCRYISELVGRSDARRHDVKLLDAPGADLRVATIEEVILQEVEHAQEHLRDIAHTRNNVIRPV